MDTAATLSQLLGPLRRVVGRSARNAAGLPDLPDSQISLLRVLAAEPGIMPSEVAERLDVAPSTVSNLLRAMTASGLAERRSSPENLRTVSLHPTEKALEMLRLHDRTSTAALAGAIARLDQLDRETLDRALPVLDRLLTILRDS